MKGRFETLKESNHFKRNKKETGKIWPISSSLAFGDDGYPSSYFVAIFRKTSKNLKFSLTVAIHAGVGFNLLVNLTEFHNTDAISQDQKSSAS